MSRLTTTCFTTWPTTAIYATNAGDGSGRLFIVEQSGQIRIVENDVLLPTPFLDIADKIPTLNSSFDERGFLGLAFHPDYATNGRFFIRYSVPREGDSSEPCFGTSRGCHSEVLAENSVSAGNPYLADPNSEIILFTIDEPQFNHNAGNVAFGPEGFLYFTLGDGGGAHDGLADSPPSHGSIGNGQNIETALGSILRIDVDSPPQIPLAYAIPPDNPFVGMTGLDEIYAYGMRNPYRFSFDNGPGWTAPFFVPEWDLKAHSFNIRLHFFLTELPLLSNLSLTASDTRRGHKSANRRSVFKVLFKVLLFDTFLKSLSLYNLINRLVWSRKLSGIATTALGASK